MNSSSVVRTVERTVPRIAAADWIEITRRGKTTTNFYRFRVPVARVNKLLDVTTELRDRRIDARNQRLAMRSDPTKVAGHSPSDPTKMADHEPTKVSGHDPTEMTGKPMKGTSEGEPLNKNGAMSGKPLVGTYTRETEIPSDEARFGPWIRMNIPDQAFHREALRLLRERKMTPEILRRLAA